MLAKKLEKASKSLNADADQAIAQALLALETLQNDAVDASSTLWSETYLMIGKAYREAGKLGEAIQYLLLAEDATYATDNKSTQLEAISLISFLYLDLGLYEKATEYSLKRLRLAQELDELASIIGAHNYLGVILYEHGDYPQALTFFHQSLELAQAVEKSPYPVSMIYTNMSRVYLDSADYASARFQAEQALEIYVTEDKPYCLTEAYATLAEISLFMKESDKAFNYADQAIVAADEFDSDYWRVRGMLIMGLLHIQMAQPLASLAYLEHALELAQFQSMYNVQRDVHEQLSRAFRDINNFEKALNHYQQYHQLYTRIFNDESNRRLRTLEIIHKTEQAQQEIDRQKALREQEQQKFEKLTQLQQQFVQTASHDMKTPLTSIRFNLELMERHQKFAPELQRFLDRIDRSTDKITHLVLDVLDLAKLDFDTAFQFKPIDLAPFLHTVIDEYQEYARKNKVHLRLLTNKAEVQILGDETQLAQAIGNIVTNSIKYNQTDGEVTISHHLDDKQVAIQITDTGIGIPQKYLSRIFEPFYRAVDKDNSAVEGTGLGLHLCQRIIESHNGIIAVESTVGVGTTFTVTLPRK